MPYTAFTMIGIVSEKKRILSNYRQRVNMVANPPDMVLFRGSLIIQNTFFLKILIMLTILSVFLRKLPSKSLWQKKTRL